MPIGYLITVTLMACLVFFAIVAPRRSRFLAQLSFLLGLVVNELPVLAMAWLLVSTALLVADGDAGSPLAAVALVVMAFTMAGLVVIFVRATWTRSVIAAALDAGLGPMWKSDADADALARWHKTPPYALLLLMPLWVWRRGVKRTANIRYGPHPKFHTLDVYRGPSAVKDAPVLVYLHGGGYFGGRKRWEAQPLLQALASRGWVCVSANYRLRPQFGFADHLTDAKRAIAWAREHADAYGGDASFIVAAGSSAGAHLASICALTQNDATLQPGFEETDTSLAAVVCLYGYYGFYHGMRETDEPRSSPIAYDAAAAPPFFLAHGDHDARTPVETARELVDGLRAESARPVVYAELPGAQHAFDLFRSVRFDAVVNGVEVFLDRVRQQRA